MERAPIISGKKAEQMESIKKKLLGGGDPRETLLSLFDKLQDDYELVEKVIGELKQGKLTDDERERLRAIDDSYAGALNEWVEELTPPGR